VEFSVRCPSPPNTYSYVREENLGSTRKFVQNCLLFTCISNLILAIHTQSMNGLEEPFSDNGENFLQPTRSGCNVRRNSISGILFSHIVFVLTYIVFDWYSKSTGPQGVKLESNVVVSGLGYPVHLDASQ
jgi:hypothetical protein